MNIQSSACQNVVLIGDDDGADGKKTINTKLMSYMTN